MTKVYPLEATTLPTKKVYPLEARTLVVKKTPFKMAIFLIILFILICSDIFIYDVLDNFSGAVYNKDRVSSKGTVIQAGFLAMGYILVDLLSQGKVL